MFYVIILGISTNILITMSTPHFSKQLSIPFLCPYPYMQHEIPVLSIKCIIKHNYIGLLFFLLFTCTCYSLFSIFTLTLISVFPNILYPLTNLMPNESSVPIMFTTDSLLLIVISFSDLFKHINIFQAKSCLLYKSCSTSAFNIQQNCCLVGRHCIMKERRKPWIANSLSIRVGGCVAMCLVWQSNHVKISHTHNKKKGQNG